MELKPSLLDKTQSRIDLIYDQYVKVLSLAASNYGGEFVPKSHQAPPPACHTVCFHDLLADDHGCIILLDDGKYNIDLDLAMIQANVTICCRLGSHMPHTCWKSLPPETQTIWHSIPDNDKASY
jgi:hypothetical protein